MLAILAAITKSYFFWILYGLYGLGVLIPSLAVTWRRMQDTGRNGLWILLGLIPFVGGIILLIFMILPGTPGPNEFGPEPAAIPPPESPAAPARIGEPEPVLAFLLSRAAPGGNSARMNRKQTMKDTRIMAIPSDRATITACERCTGPLRGPGRPFSITSWRREPPAITPRPDHPVARTGLPPAGIRRSPAGAPRS